MFEVSVSATFDATHYIEAAAGAPGYKRMHGHSFVVTASVAADAPGADGWVIDLGKLEALLKSVAGELDHSILNEIPGLEKPTFENILLWIDAKLRAAGVTPSRLEIERPTLKQRAVYTPRA